MNTSNYRFTLDIQSTMSQASLPVRLGDTNRKLYITITEGGNPYILHDGFTAAFVGKKPDGHNIFNHCIIENQSVVRYDFTPQTANASGLVDCEIRIYDPDGFVVTSPKFVMVIDERVVYDGDVSFSEDEATYLDNIITSERSRISAEEARETEETARSEAENNRDVAETARANAESERAAAETARALRFQGLVDQLNIALASKGVRTTEVTLYANAWVGTESPYSQVVQVESVTAYSKVDLLPSAEQLVAFKEKDLDLVTENEGGKVTVFAIGTKPTQDWTIQATVTEVAHE